MNRIITPVPLEAPLEASLFPSVSANGATDAHSEFDVVGTLEVRERVARAAADLLRNARPDMDVEDVFISCFSEPYDDEALAAADAYKVSRPSSVPEGGFVEIGEYTDFKGDDSNEANLIGRAIQHLRGQRALVGKEMNLLYERGELTEAARAAGMAQTKAINAQIAEMQRLKADATTPVYYATPFSGLLEDDGEDNPLGYAGALPATTHLAFYDGAALRAAGIRVTENPISSCEFTPTAARSCSTAWHLCTLRLLRSDLR